MRQFLLLCFSVVALHASAQVIEKGEKFFGGSFGTSASNSGGSNVNNRNSNAGFYPALAFGIGNNQVLGVRGQISYSRSKINQNMGQIVQAGFGTGLGFFFKKYRPLQDRFGLYFEHALNGTFTEQSLTHYNNSVSYLKNWGAGYGFSPGVFFRFSDRFIGEANIGGLNFNYYGDDSDGHHYTVGASFLQSFHLGINYRFGKRKEQQEQ